MRERRPLCGCGAGAGTRDARLGGGGGWQLGWVLTDDDRSSRRTWRFVSRSSVSDRDLTSRSTTLDHPAFDSMSHQCPTVGTRTRKRGVLEWGTTFPRACAERRSAESNCVRRTEKSEAMGEARRGIRSTAGNLWARSRSAGLGCGAR